MNELMEGVRVLSENVIEIKSDLSLFLFVLTLCSAVIFAVCLVSNERIFATISIIIGICFGLLFFNTFTSKSIIRTQYKVTISDTVNFKEFTQKYEVINVDGEIYTVVEKKVEEDK